MGGWQEPLLGDKDFFLHVREQDFLHVRMKASSICGVRTASICRDKTSFVGVRRVKTSFGEEDRDLHAARS